MNRTLSALILENFVIDEGAKFERIKKGAKKVGYGVAGTVLGTSLLFGGGALKNKHDANKDYKSNHAIVQAQHDEGVNKSYNDAKWKKFDIDWNDDIAPRDKETEKEKITKEHNKSVAASELIKDEETKKLTDTKDKVSKKANRTLKIAGAVASVPLVAGGALALADKDLKMKYHNDRVQANNKKVKKDLDKIDKNTNAEGKVTGDVDIEKLKGRITKHSGKAANHREKFKETHFKAYDKLTDDIMYKPTEAERVYRDPRQTRFVQDPSLLTAQIKNKANTDDKQSREQIAPIATQRDNRVEHNTELEKSGKTPKGGTQPNAVPQAVPQAAPKPVNNYNQTSAQKAASEIESLQDRVAKMKTKVNK